MGVMLAGMLDVNTSHDRKVNINIIVLSVLEFRVPVPMAVQVFGLNV